MHACSQCRVVRSWCTKVMEGKSDCFSLSVRRVRLKVKNRGMSSRVIDHHLINSKSRLPFRALRDVPVFEFRAVIGMSASSPSRSPTRRVKLDLANNSPEKSAPKSPKAMKLIPEWASKAASRRRSWKLLVRCWVATWVCFILILPNKTLPVMGWAWGSAAMAAALQARDQVLLGRALLSTQQAATNEANPDAYFRKAVFRGDFLDPRSTVVFGVFLAIGAFFLALMRVKSPKLTLARPKSYGPLFPSGQYLILQTFLVSSSIYLAVGLVTIVLIFPETLSHEWLESYAGVLDLVKGLVDMQEKVLTDNLEQLDMDTEGNTLSRVDGIQAGILATFQAFTAKTPMLNLEFSHGRWSAADVQGLELPLRALLTRAHYRRSFIIYCTIQPSSLHTDGRFVPIQYYFTGYDNFRQCL
ncbi:hypothetical protein AG1IA_06672 [Rhizoctonia solani AG-1 IA]|uniref:Putative ER transporter 6TM N-terminal domain-containing protein n=1 Tax=Thanatephorus cucumeris (strain AG1-IA) TaxID=983506 RepID=L8WMD3_THACA|nr:hypothetical protein AG1IA_06672 [Rhizoctonia solani AG-1 IA]